MMGQLETIRHQEIGPGLLLVTDLLMPTVIAAVDIALVPLMIADGIALVVLPLSPNLQSCECVSVYDTRMG